MADYREIKSVAKELREIYGGTMSISDLMVELGTNRSGAKQWADENVLGIKVKSRVRYEVRKVAEAIVNQRGFY